MTNTYPSLVLLLGSYDPDTKNILLRIKEYVAREFTDHVYALLLETVEFYLGTRDEEQVYLMIEGEHPAAYLFTRDGRLADIVPLTHTGDQGAKEASDKLKVNLKVKFTVLEKLQTLARSCELVFIIRHAELTRCGEYIELTFLLDQGLDPRKVYFLWNTSVPLSTMLKELLDLYNFNLRPYHSLEELLDEVHRIIYYRVKALSKQQRHA